MPTIAVADAALPIVPSPDVSMRSKISLFDYLVGADEAV